MDVIHVQFLNVRCRVGMATRFGSMGLDGPGLVGSVSSFFSPSFLFLLMLLELSSIPKLVQKNCFKTLYENLIKSPAQR